MTSRFIKTLADTIGYIGLNRSTQVRVFQDEYLRIAIPECCDVPVQGGTTMTAGELEDALSSFVNDEMGGYKQNVCCGDMELDENSFIVLYGVTAYI